MKRLLTLFFTVILFSVPFSSMAQDTPSVEVADQVSFGTVHITSVYSDGPGFIVIHQVFELWFKLVIREITLATERMSQKKVDEELIPFVVQHLRRVNTILESAIKHFDLMETLTPQDFLMFRAKLGTASGFQSFQMRKNLS